MNYYDFFGIKPDFDLDKLQTSFLEKFLIIEEAYQGEGIFLDQLAVLNKVIDMYLTLRIESKRENYNKVEGITLNTMDPHFYYFMYVQYSARFGGEPLQAYENEINRLLSKYQDSSFKSSFINDFEVRRELLKLIEGLQSIKLIDAMFKSMLKSSYNIDIDCPDDARALLRIGGI